MGANYKQVCSKIGKHQLNKSHILITGIGRSGTMFTAKILSYSPEVVLLPEPLEPNYGLEGVDCSFPYISYDCEENKYIRLLNDFFSYKARYKKIIQRIILPRKL